MLPASPSLITHNLLAVPSRAPILDQGHCASCYAFAAAGVLTDRISMVDSAYLKDAAGIATTVSPQYLMERCEY